MIDCKQVSGCLATFMRGLSAGKILIPLFHYIPLNEKFMFDRNRLI